MAKENFYYKYLRSRKWQRKRRMIIRKFKTCVLCDSDKRLEVHHRHYRNLGNETVEDLTLLCHDCHSRYHAYKKSLKKTHSRTACRTAKKEPKKRGVIIVLSLLVMIHFLGHQWLTNFEQLTYTSMTSGLNSITSNIRSRISTMPCLVLP